jgi:hypothetical protein
MAQHTTSMDAIRQAREALTATEQNGVPDSMQSAAISVDALRALKEKLSEPETTRNNQTLIDSVESAAVRPELPKRESVTQETERRMGIAAADRRNRQAAGLPPRTFDLR